MRKSVIILLNERKNQKQIKSSLSGLNDVIQSLFLSSDSIIRDTEDNLSQQMIAKIYKIKFKTKRF